MHPAARKAFLAFHQWAGLILGLVGLVVALSGAGLVFRRQLERRLDAARFVVVPGAARLPADELVARARAVHPAAAVVGLHCYGDATMPCLVYFADKYYVHLDPGTGAVLGTRARYGEGFGWVEGLHKYLRIEPDNAGELVTGTAALVFSLIILTGIVLWWPATRRALQAGLTLNWRLRGRPWNLNLHKTGGIFAAAVLLVSSLTGLPLALDWAKDALYLLTGSVRPSPPAAQAGPAGRDFAGFEAVRRSLAGRFPGAEEFFIPLPRKGLVAAYVIAAGAPHPNARSLAWLDPSTAEILRVTPYAQAGAGHRLYYWMISLHTGELGGPVAQVLLLLGALAVPVLVFTGTVAYFQRKARRAAAAGEAAVPVLR